MTGAYQPTTIGFKLAKQIVFLAAANFHNFYAAQRSFISLVPGWASAPRVPSSLSDAMPTYLLPPSRFPDGIASLVQTGILVALA